MTGSEMYNGMMRHYQDKKMPINTINDKWHNKSHIGDNFKAYRDARVAGHSPISAARQTFSGKMARAWGYEPTSVSENEHVVVADFSRPKASSPSSPGKRGPRR